MQKQHLRRGHHESPSPSSNLPKKKRLKTKVIRVFSLPTDHNLIILQVPLPPPSSARSVWRRTRSGSRRNPCGPCTTMGRRMGTTCRGRCRMRTCVWWSFWRRCRWASAFFHLVGERWHGEEGELAYMQAPFDHVVGN